MQRKKDIYMGHDKMKTKTSDCYIILDLIKETAVGFMETADLSAQGISQKILEVL
jgi:hypothetical protein